MDLYHLISYPLYAGGILEVILGLALLRQAPGGSRAMRAGALLYFSAAVFVFCTAVSYTLASQGRDYNFFNRATWIGWFMVPACLQFIYYLQDENSRVARIVGWTFYPFWTVIFALTLFTDLVEPGDPSLIPYVNIDGPLEEPSRIIGSFMALWLLIEVYRARTRMAGIKKQQLSLFLYGTMFFTGGCIVIAGIQPVVGAVDPALASYFSLPWVVLTYFAITRHRLFDLRVMISRLLNVVFLSLAVSLVHILLFKILSPALGESLAIMLSLSFIGVLLFGTPFRPAVQRRIQQMVLQDKYDYQSVLRESTKAIITILKLDELLDYIIASMKKGLGVENICLVIREKNDWVTRQPDRSVRGESANGCPVNTAVVDLLRRTQEIIVREELDRTSSDNSIAIVCEYMKTTSAELIIPLGYKGDVRGFIVLGRKGNGEPYVQSDIDLLEMLAGQTAVAIENARLYEDARQARRSFKESEQKFGTLADTAAIAIFIHQGGNFLYANKAAEIIGGYTVEEYLTMNFMSLVHPAFIDLVRERARERLSSGDAPTQYEFKIVRKNGAERWVLMTAGVTEYEGQSAVLGTLIDITGRKRAEEERERYYQELQAATRSLLESETRFRTLAETTTAGIIIYREGRLIYVNPACEQLTGRDRAELMTTDFWDIIHPDYRDTVRRRGEARMRGENVPPEYEYAIVTKNNELRWISMTAGVIEYEGKTAVIATLFDITDRKRAEAEMVNLYEQRIGEEKRHVLEKEKILMDLHDGIGGITTNISILSELAQKSEDIEGIKKKLAIISRLSREGIGEIRSFMHSLDSKELNWRTLAVELRNQGNSMLEPHGIGFDLKTDIAEDREQPGSLLWVNLFKIYKEALMNVIKHAKARQVAVLLEVLPQEVQLIVRDDGVGLKTDACGGRGLSNMKQRAGELGGSAEISPGPGACIRIRIPLPLKYPEEGMVL